MNQQDCTAQTIRLRDGRTLGYAEWGDLTGIPVFYFGGSNSARLSRHPDESTLRETGIHLYTFDRPGMGLSTRQRGRRLLDWSDDIRDFATQRDIDRFVIVAASQGGPYGVACAYALPDLLAGVWLVSAVSPLVPDIMATQRTAIRAQVFMARHLPGLLTVQNSMMRPMLRGDRTKRLVTMVLDMLPDSDRQVLSIPGWMDVMIADIREGMRQGGAGGTDDIRAVALDWGFRLEDIRTKVVIWQGEDDPNVTPAMAHYLAARIPDNETVFVPGAGHMLVYTHWRDILTQLAERY